MRRISVLISNFEFPVKDETRLWRQIENCFLFRILVRAFFNLPGGAGAGGKD